MAEAFPAKAIYVEVVVCKDRARESEFNWWYDEVFLRRLRSAVDVDGVYRYRDAEPDLGELADRRWTPFAEGESRYLTIYRLPAVGAEAVAADIGAFRQRLASEDRPDLYRVLEGGLWEFVAYRRRAGAGGARRPPDGMPAHLLVVYGGTDGVHRREHDRWWQHLHSHDLLETPGLVECHRWQAGAGTVGPTQPDVLNLYEIEADDAAEVFRTILRGDRVRRAHGRFSPFSRRVEAPGSGLYVHWDNF